MHLQARSKRDSSGVEIAIRQNGGGVKVRGMVSYEWQDWITLK